MIHWCQEETSAVLAAIPLFVPIILATRAQIKRIRHMILSRRRRSFQRFARLAQT